MARSVDITGKKFGRLMALEIVGKSRRENVWRCHCECGKVVDVRLSNLRNKNTTSCGCWQKESRFRK